MNQKIKKWGNSLAIRIPKAIAELFNLKQDETVNIQIENEKLIISPVKTCKKSLDDLLEEITPINIHSEISYGNTQGNEEW